MNQPPHCMERSMKDEAEIKGQLVDKLAKLRQRIAELESLEVAHKLTEEELRQSEEINRVLFSISNAVNTTDNLEELYEFIHKSLGLIIDVTNFYIALYDRNAQFVTFPYFVDEVDRTFHSSFTPKDIDSSALTGKVIRTGCPLLVNKEELLRRIQDHGEKIYGTPPEVWLGVPLKVKDEVIGVMATQSYTDPNRYSQRDFDILLSVSDQVALVIERKRSEEALRESEEKYRSLVEFTEDSVYLVDRNRQYLFMNEKYLSRLCLPKDKTIGRTYDEFHSREETNEFAEKMSEVFRTGRFVQYEHRSSRDGRYFLRTLSPVEEPGGSIKAVTVISKDITERKRTEEFIQRERETFFSILNKAPYGAVLIDKDGKYLYANSAFTTITGYTLKDVPTGRDWFRKACPDQKYRHEIIAIWKRDFAQRGVDNRAFSVVCKDGTVREIEFRTTVLDDNRVIVMLSDITERKRLEGQLTYMATHDVLTGLPNRMLFNDRLNLVLAQAQRHQHKLAVMVLDLDRFKDINDTLGHSVGDRLLQSVGDRLRRSLRKSDIVARMGGDEFLFLLPEVTRAEDSLEVARKILKVFRKSFLVERYELRITASIGIAVYPDDGEDADILMKNADTAMYRAKKKGRNTYQRYTSAMKLKALK